MMARMKTHLLSAFFTMTILALPACAAQTTSSAPAPAVASEPETTAEIPFDAWLDAFKQEAAAEGISVQLLERAFAGVAPDGRIIRLDRRQPESTKSFSQYLQDVVNQRRIEQGRAMMQRHQPLLEEIAARYGVQPRFIIALWGIETNYGGYTGNFPIVEALATLAHDGRRSAFFRKELMNALRILQ
jgi:membrane-bound lytic murein transglycosylase B